MPASRFSTTDALVAGDFATGFDPTLAALADGTRHVCHLIPLERPFDEGGRNVKDKSLRLLVIRPSTGIAQAISNAKALFALTDRKRDVLFCLVDVGNVPATASALGMSASSARTHLKALFAKTNTHRQADLVRLVASLESPFRADTLKPGD